MSLRVLVVDDMRENVFLIRTMLGKAGYEVDFAYDGDTALKLMAQGPFDVVLLDVMMPMMDGFEVLEKIRSTPAIASIPVIMVTARTQDSDLLTGYRGGADYYITKPFTSQQLLYGISLVLGQEKAI